MSAAAGTLPNGGYVATEDGQVLSIHVDQPTEGMTVLAFSDREDDSSVLLLPSKLFELAAKTYLGAQGA